MDEKVKRLETVCEEVIAAIDAFPIDKREEIVFDRWDLKDVIAHLSGWNLLRIKEINDLLNGRDIDFLTDYDKFNECEVEKRRKLTWEEVYQEFIDSCKDLIDYFQQIPMELWNKAIWLDKDFTPMKWVDIDISHMRDEHLRQLKDYQQQKYSHYWLPIRNFIRSLVNVFSEISG